jgi:hypothetical protein
MYVRIVIGFSAGIVSIVGHSQLKNLHTVNVMTKLADAGH